MSEEAKKDLRERLEFFFSDANLRQDDFMRKILLKNTGDYPHQITVDVLLKFNTIKSYTTDAAVLVEVAKSLPEKLVVSSDEKAIGRVNTFTVDQMKGHLPLSLYISNLPLKKSDDDKQEYAIKADQLRDIFQEYGKVAMVKLRFRNDRNSKRRQPKGSAWVEFEDADSVAKAAADVLTVKDGAEVEPKRKIELEGSQIGVELLEEHEGLKKKRDVNGTSKGEAQNGDDDEEKKDKSAEFVLDWKPGCVIRLEGLSVEECDREAILDAVAEGLSITVDEVKERKIYADYSRGQENGAIRFPDVADDIKTLCEKFASGDVKVKGAVVKVAKILEGDEETTYWNDFIEFKKKQKQNHGSNQKRNKKFRRD
ncbi:lupus La protein [Fistulifera solaris]|uniref:Lupus La protein n=1 Tax=Fistulifera solaris TaxID=1519565 RepID=A0A1Z5JEI2_FISSO|nr:lupus La protein [Fistulifera solaris]|eukprot:GAX12171.1 lupus La protein [Fistulifera solaris]